jgi:hypothetical protein
MNCIAPLWKKNVEKTMLLCHWAIMTWAKGKQLRTEVSHHGASTVWTIHSMEPFFRTFHHIAEQSFPFPLGTPHSGAILMNCRENERTVSGISP